MDANKISNYVISLAQNSVEENLTNLKLQKILYYLQGYHLAIFNKRLFDDEIEAWKFGPVVKEVYHTYKSYGTNSIILPDVEKNFDYISNSQKKFINRVYAYFRQFSAVRLMEMTHEDTPWRATYGKRSAIPIELLRNFFLESELIRVFSLSDTKEERKQAAQFLLSDYVYDINLTESTISDTEDIYEY